MEIRSVITAAGHRLSPAWRWFASGLDRHRILWLILWAASMLSILDIPTSIEFHIPPALQVAYIVIAGAFKGSFILALCLLCDRCRWSRVAAYVAVGIYVLLAVVNFLSLYFFDFGITRRMISIILQTNPSEAREFIAYSVQLLGQTLMSWVSVMTVAASCLAVMAVRRIPRRWLTRTAGVLSAVGLLMAAAFACSYTSGRTAHSLVLRIIKYGRETYHDLREFEAMKNELAPLPDADSITSRHLAATVVVVIGESASRSHWSAYGYPLPTTPRICAMADSLYIMPDVIGSSASTSLNLENILTLRNDDTPEGGTPGYPRLVDIFNHAGYKTFWLSNQERTGLISNMSGVLASDADVIRYIGAQSSEDLLISRYDEALLPYLRDALADSASSKLIFIHMMGSHFVFSSRYPREARYFTPADVRSARGGLTDDEAQTISEYDNTIRYTDALLARMIDDVARMSESAVMIYFSDHGVNVYDEGGIQGRGEHFVEVPAFIYVNGAYRRDNPDVVTALDAAYRRPVTTASLAYPLMTLTGTTYTGYDATRDFMSPQYLRRHRYVDYKPWRYEK